MGQPIAVNTRHSPLVSLSEHIVRETTSEISITFRDSQRL